jgi:hypothetical protein
MFPYLLPLWSPCLLLLTVFRRIDYPRLLYMCQLALWNNLEQSISCSCLVAMFQFYYFFCLFIVYLKTLSVSRLYNVRWEDDREQWTGKDVEGSGHGLISGTFPAFAWGGGLRRITKNLSQDSRSPGRDLNPGPPEYEAGELANFTKNFLCRNVRKKREQ